MNIINFHVNKGRKNFSKNKHNNKQFLLPSLIPKKDNNQKKAIIPFKYVNKNQNLKVPINKINNQLKKQRNNIQNKLYEQQKLFKNHKPYSGNPSIKCNDNINELNKPLKYSNQLNLEREIFTANPSLIGSKNNFNNNVQDNNKQFNNINNNQILLMKNKNNSNTNIYLYNTRNDLNAKDNMRENISAKYKYYQDKAHKYYKKLGIGVSKSSPKFSSIEIVSKYENQKQKDNFDFHKNLKVIMNYNNENNNIIHFKRNSNMNFDYNKNINDYNKFLLKEKNKQFNLGSIHASLNSNSEAQNMLIKAVGKIKLQLEQKHSLKSASIINMNNHTNEDYSKIKNNDNNYNIKLINNSSKQNLNNSINNNSNIFRGLNNTSFSTISPHSASINNNSTKHQNNIYNKNNKPKISKCFISYAYNDYPNLEHRQEMEDFHCIKQALGKNPNLSYFSIFDGHGGKEVASFLSLNFHRTLINEINSVIFTDNNEQNINIIIEIIKNSFNKIDQDIINNANYPNDVGSTATIIIIYYNLDNNECYNEKNKKKIYKRTLICANIGDSNGFLINKNYIKPVTKAHKCDDILEVKRIKEQGGIVFQGRIFGKLILTRTIGDKEMKKYGVIPLPDFFIKNIEDDDLFVIIGSDGIWDVIDQEEVFNMGKEKGISSEEFSIKLINLAKERDTRDNTSCIVIKLNKNI